MQDIKKPQPNQKFGKYVDAISISRSLCDNKTEMVAKG